MCGIVGTLGFGSNKILDNMVSKMQHRGPDALGTYISESHQVYLGHARLSIIDLSVASNQPLWDAEEQTCIVFNGEIYNFLELRNDLVDQGRSFKTNGEAEVILELYKSDPLNWLKKLEGMFALCLWDKEKNISFIARDGFGVKPLYYKESDEGVAFASEIKSLLEIPSLSKELDIDAILRSLVFLWSPGPSTILSSVKKLEAGFVLTVKGGKIESNEQFTKWPSYKPGNIDSVTSIADALEKSVKKQSVADVEVGAFLSGGVDSSILVAMMKKQGLKPQCFTIDSSTENNDGFLNDLPFAKRVAKDLSLDLNVVKADPEIYKLFSKMVYHLDEPQADPAPLNVLKISELARDKKIKVLMSGAGGDDVFSGYRRHRAIKLERYWKHFPSAIRKSISYAAKNLPKNNPSLRRLSKAFYFADLNENERLLSYFFWLDPKIAVDLFTDEARDKLSDNPLEEMLAGVESLKESDALEKMLYLERKYFLVDHNLNYTDKMSMACGIEVRVPFLDSEVVKVASQIPSSEKVKKGQAKYPLKKAAEKYLSKDIVYRSKSGFGAPLRSWLNCELKDYVDEKLSEENLAKRNIFSFSKVREMIDKDRSGEEDYSYSIFAVLMLELWFQIFLDKNEAVLKEI